MQATGNRIGPRQLRPGLQPHPDARAHLQRALSAASPARRRHCRTRQCALRIAGNSLYGTRADQSSTSLRKVPRSSRMFGPPSSLVLDLRKGLKLASASGRGCGWWPGGRFAARAADAAAHQLLCRGIDRAHPLVQSLKKTYCQSNFQTELLKCVRLCPRRSAFEFHLMTLRTSPAFISDVLIGGPAVLLLLLYEQIQDQCNQINKSPPPPLPRCIQQDVCGNHGDYPIMRSRSFW